MKKEFNKVILPLNPSDEKLLQERADYINQTNDKIKRIKASLFDYLQYTFSDKGDNQKILFEIPFEAVTFHDLDDKKAYEKGTFVNFNVLGIYKIRVKYLEGIRGDNCSAFATLKIDFLWNELLSGRTQKSGVASPYYGNFEDNKLCFAETFVFQTQEQYEEFKEIHNELRLLAQELGLF